MSTYGLKYRSLFDSISGNLYEIRIFEKDYIGEVSIRNLGNSPVLKMDDAGSIRGTSLELNIEAVSDGDLQEFYTIDNKKFRVEVFRNNKLFWIGYTLPELYSEPYVASPFDVAIAVSDGIGILKNVDFDFSDQHTLFGIINYCCSKTELQLGYVFASTLYAECMNKARVMHIQASVMAETFAGMSCYDVLENVLTTLGSYIKQKNGKWYILRYTDQDQKLFEYDSAGDFIRTVDPVVLTLGAMGDDTYPIGQLDSEILPAKKDIVIEQPYDLFPSFLKNYDFSTETAWVTNHGSYKRIEDLTYFELRSVAKGEAVRYVKQDIDIVATEQPIRIELEYGICFDALVDISTVQMGLEREFQLEISLQSGSIKYYLTADGWKTTQGSIKIKGTLQTGKIYNPRGPNLCIVPDSFDTFKINLNKIPYSGTLSVCIINPYTYTRPPGGHGGGHGGGQSGGGSFVGDWENMNLIALKKVILVNNVEANPDLNVLLNENASTSADNVKISFLDAPFTENAEKVFVNALKFGSIYTKNWACEGSNTDSFVNIALQDISGRVGQALLLLKGTIAAIDYDLLVDKYSAKKLYALEYSYNLLEEEIDCTLCEFTPFLDTSGEITKSPRSSNKSKTETRVANETEYRSYGGSVMTPKMIRELPEETEPGFGHCLEIDDSLSGNSRKIFLETLIRFIHEGVWTKEELKYIEGYLKIQDKKIKAGDSDLWDKNEFSDYLDQPVRTTDDVQFRDILGRIITLTEGLMTDNFVAGMSGAGVGIVNKAEVHADKAVFRKYIEVLSLVVSKMYWRGGRQVLSPAGMKISKVEELDNCYRCYMETDDGQTNDFTVGAQARCNDYGNNRQKYYWRLVTGTGSNYVDLSKTDKDGEGLPEVGDDLVQFGHRTDPYLQWVVMDSSFPDDAGRAIYSGVNSYDLSGKLSLKIGVDPQNQTRIGLFTKHGEFSDIIEGIEQNIQDAIAKTVQVTAPGQVFKYGSGYTGTPTPAGIVLTATSRNFTPDSYQWQYLNGSTWTDISGATGATYSVVPGNTTLFPSGTNVRTFRCICNGDEKLSDSFTIAKLADGATGATGSAGADAYTVLLTNEAHAFVGSASAALAGSTPCQIIAYKGATQVAVTIGSITGLPTGMTASTSNNGTTSATVTFAVTTSMTTASGTISIPLTVDGKSFTRVFSYSVAFRGATGATGAKGETGPTGSQGIPGTSQYFHVKYSANSNGNPMSDTPNTYIGTVVTSSATAPTGYTSYKWVQLKGSQGAQGTQGIPGVNGTNGKTTYLHIKYSDNGTSFTANNGETPGAYIGQYTDFTAADSMTFSAYTWTKVKGETGSTGAPGAQGIPGESITGKMLFKDPMFAKGINGVLVYSNAAADVRAKLTVERVYRPSDAPTKGSYCLRITCKAPQSPDYGGVVQSLFSRANAVFIQKIIANIPVGYSIRSATNSMGSGYKDVWLTSCAGTGKYETYLRKVTCGASGTFSGGGHVYISGSPVPTESAPLIWHIAYMTAFDMTDDGYADIEYDAKNDLAQQLGFTDYAALEANALTQGPLIKAGQINAVLINTTALIADTAFISNIKTKVLTAGSITAGMLASNFVFTKQIQIGPNASTINFKVDSNGVMTAKGADISGNINATTGSFGNIQISGSEFVSKNGGTISFKRDNDSVRMFSGSSRLSISIANNSGNSCLYLFSQSNLANPCLDIMRQVNGTAITSYGGCTFCIRNGEEFAVILPNNGYIQGFKVTNNSVIARVPVTFDSRLTLNGIPQRSGSGNWRAVVMNLNDRRIYWQ